MPNETKKTYTAHDIISTIVFLLIIVRIELYYQFISNNLSAEVIFYSLFSIGLLSLFFLRKKGNPDTYNQLTMINTIVILVMIFILALSFISSFVHLEFDFLSIVYLLLPNIIFYFFCIFINFLNYKV
jgi:hypothetical protein